MGQIKSEKIDPLIRIQEEIKEVVRREEEHRQLTTGGSSPISANEYETHHENGTVNNSYSHIDNDSTNSISISPVPHSSLNNLEGSLNIPSLPHSENSVNSKESIDDDSGISASPSPVNGVSANQSLSESTKPSKEQRYIGPNCYTITPEPPRQMIIANSVPATPPVVNRQRMFAFNPANKGVMQRFIATRGRLQMNNNNNNGSNKIFLNTKNAAALLNTSTMSPLTINTATGALASPLHSTMALDILTPSITIPTVTMTPPLIERDAEGRVIRRGYVPAEVKIQKEIKDLQAREHELKKRNRFRQSTSDLLEAIGNDHEETDDEDSEVEHCVGPRQLRSAKSISEISYSTQLNNSISPRATPSPDIDVKKIGSGAMRPAMSLAQLCDLPPEEAPSSHRLIVEWENRIQMNAARNSTALPNEE
ncbi:PREDICTED: ankyrin repeat-containing protein kinase A [Rhagoletis zephyria]|uniref:ankyrin repeat-containing protein kinase A n=1 Tax=Rhagoletis zephyria TaxID=28612 RepID=UPI0008115B37|nr:PREDICTED: ankyrin repeat-containing protein kinase A [Rhagoletis zephyria]